VSLFQITSTTMFIKSLIKLFLINILNISMTWASLLRSNVQESLSTLLNEIFLTFLSACLMHILIIDWFNRSRQLDWSLSRVFISTFWLDSITWVESSDLTWILKLNLLTQLNIDLESEFNLSSWLNLLNNWIWCQES